MNPSLFDPKEHSEWQACHWTLPEFWASYSDHLPVLVKVSNGYCGSSDFDVYSNNEVFLITSSSTQPRVVAKDMTFSQGHISIPYDYHVKFEVVNKRGKGDGKKQSIGDIMKNHKPPVTVRMRHDSNIRFRMSAESNRLAKFQDLHIESTYLERYLHGNIMLKGFVSTESPCSIPLYLPIRVSVAEGPLDKTVSQREWKSMMLTLGDLVTASDHSKSQMNKDLMLYHNEDISGEDVFYETLMPRYSLKQSFGNMDSLGKVATSGSGAEEADEHKYDPLDVKLQGNKNRRPIKSVEDIPEYTGSGAEVVDDVTYEPVDVKLLGNKTRRPIKSVANIPENISSLSVSEISDCLLPLNMGDVIPLVREKQVNGALLQALEVSDLKDELDLPGISAKKLYLFAQNKWRPDTS